MARGTTAPGVSKFVDFTQRRDQPAAFSIIGDHRRITSATLHPARLAGLGAGLGRPADCQSGRKPNRRVIPGYGKKRDASGKAELALSGRPLPRLL